MKELGKWQIISFLSRGIAMVLGLVQTFVIIRVLSVGEWGIIQLAISIGGALGIYQHLGLASASTREISSASDDKEIFKIFITSAVIRYAITVPIAIALFFGSKYLAVDIYKNYSLIVPLKLYAVTLIFQGVQSILNSVISGMKKFKRLFLYQILIAAISVIIFIPLVVVYKIDGYFYAFVTFNIISSASLAYLAFQPLKGKLVFPSKSDFKRLFKEIFSISMAIYLVKIIYTNWEKFGGNVLGLFNSPEVVAIFAFAMLYAKKLMSISDSVTDVNLPVLSERYVKDIDDFKRLFSKNFDKIFIAVIASAAFASYWSPEIVKIIVGSDKYQESYSLIPPVIFAFIIYSFINIIKSSVLIPAKMVKHMIISFVLLIAGTAGFFFGTYHQVGVLPSMAWAMAVGSAISFIFILITIRRKLNFNFFTIDHYAILAQGFAISICIVLPLFPRILLFIVLYGMLIWGFFIAGYVTKKEVLALFSYLKKIPRYFKVRKNSARS